MSVIAKTKGRDYVQVLQQVTVRIHNLHVESWEEIAIPFNMIVYTC